MIDDNINSYKKIVNENQLKDNDFLFSSLAFNEFNSTKCKYLFAHSTSKISMIFGVSETTMSAPFSAPFSFIRYGSKDLKIKQIRNFYTDLINDVNKNEEIEKISITLPPYFYGNSIITKNSISLSDAGFSLLHRDINSHIDVHNHNMEELGSSAKKAIRSSMKYEHEILYADDITQKKKSYTIIKQNRDSKGYPLRMTWEQIKSTTENVAKCDFFVVKTNGYDSAAAVVFHINQETVQVVYWGGNEYGEKHGVMYYLPFELIDFYKKKGVRYIDIGPSSENGVVSDGLNDYKQMIGCDNTIKETWVYNK
ncbi:hypothetical protein [Photobacterium sanguinicancri]|uniref:hypothetical protein n=1 Tax=Photobacterium sanguinicancri TaxID=875932 RepID=UPI0021C34CCD|nr:hypothetical protein [Photobacterium sanguinicancri]